MDNKIKCKGVGKVEIFELIGDLTGSFAVRSYRAISQSLHIHKRNCALFNVQGLKQIDAQGIQTLLKSTDNMNKCALLINDHPVVESMRKLGVAEKFSIFQDTDDAAFYLSREFAMRNANEKQGSERREHIRLETVLPLHFSYELPFQKEINFFAVVTNLSEGGLYAEFMESALEEKAKKYLKPYDTNPLSLKLFFTRDRSIELKGRVVYGALASEGIGMEFLGTTDEKLAILRQWLEKHLLEGQGG